MEKEREEEFSGVIDGGFFVGFRKFLEQRSILERDNITCVGQRVEDVKLSKMSGLMQVCFHLDSI